jgi:hypothetical protein
MLPLSALVGCGVLTASFAFLPSFLLRWQNMPRLGDPPSPVGLWWTSTLRRARRAGRVCPRGGAGCTWVFSFFTLSLCRSSGGGGQVVFDVDAFGDIVGREDDDFVVRELAAVGGDDERIPFGDVDRRFRLVGFLLFLLANLCVFNRGCHGRLGLVLRGIDLDEGRRMGVDVPDGAAETGDAHFEAVDLAVELIDDGGTGVDGHRGAGHRLEFAKLGDDGERFAAGFDDGEVPVDGDAGVEAFDLPAGDGHLAHEQASLLVDRLIGFEERVHELEEGLAFLVAENGAVRRDEIGESFGVFAGFDAVAGDFGFACGAGWPFGFRSILPCYLGSFFGCHTVLLSLEIQKALRFGGGPWFRGSVPFLDSKLACPVQVNRGYAIEKC